MEEEPVDRLAKCKVFISYARVDAAFADLLVEGLADRGFEPLIDRQSIEHGEEWWKRIAEMITQSAAVVFVMSPQSIDPDSVCADELSLIQNLSLRIAPVLFREPSQNVDIPADLSRLDWIRCDDLGRRYEPIAEVAIALKRAKRTGAPSSEVDGLDARAGELGANFQAALRADARLEAVLEQVVRVLSLEEVLWRREASAWVERARAWEQAGRSESLALRRREVAVLQRWANRRPSDAELPSVVLQYLEASAEHEAEEARERSRVVSRAFVKPAEEALRQGRFDAALRMSAAGMVLGDDRGLKVVPEHEPIIRDAARQMALRAICPKHEGAILDLAVAPDGRTFVTASSDWSARIWDVRIGHVERKFAKHGERVVAARFSPDGAHVATASSDRTVRVWSAAKGKEKVVLDEHAAPVKDVAFSPDGELIASASRDGKARIWRLVDGALLHTLDHEEQGVLHVSFAADGEELLTAAGSNAHIWSVANGARRTSLVGGKAQLRSASWSPDGANIVVSDDLSVRIWDARSGKILHTVAEGQGDVSLAHFTSNGRLLTAAGPVSALWCVRTGRRLAAFTSGDGAITSGDVSRDNGRVAIGTAHGVALIWDATSGEVMARFDGHDGSISQLAFAPDGTRLITASADKTARIWDCALGRSVAGFAWEGKPLNAGVAPIAQYGPNGLYVALQSRSDVARLVNAEDFSEHFACNVQGWTITSAAFSRDGRFFATGSADKTIALWSTESGQCVSMLSAHEKAVTDLQFSTDAACLLSTSDDGSARLWSLHDGSHRVYRAANGTLRAAGWCESRAAVMGIYKDKFVRVWDATDGHLRKEFRLDGQGVRFVSWRPDYEEFACAGADGVVRISTMDGDIIATIDHGSEIRTALYAPCGDVLVTTGDDRRVRIWKRSVPSLELPRFDAPVAAVAISPDSKRLVTACGRVVQIWSLGDGQRIDSLELHPGAVRAVSFSPNGRRLLTSSGQRSVYVWDVSRSDALAAPAPEIIIASLTGRRGQRSEREALDFLMSGAPENARQAAAKGMASEVRTSARARAERLAETLHRNCYVPVSQLSFWPRQKTGGDESPENNEPPPPESSVIQVAAPPRARHSHHFIALIIAFLVGSACGALALAFALRLVHVP